MCCAASRPPTRPAHLLMEQMFQYARPAGEGGKGNSLIPGYYRGWMTEEESEAFDAKEYDRFASLSKAYNEKNGYGPKRQRTD